MRTIKKNTIIFFVLLNVFQIQSQTFEDSLNRVNQIISNEILIPIFKNDVEKIKEVVLFDQKYELWTEEIEYLEDEYIMYISCSKWFIKCLVVNNFQTETPSTIWKFFVQFNDSNDLDQFLTYFPGIAGFEGGDGYYSRGFMQTLKLLEDNVLEFWLFYPRISSPKKPTD